MLFIIRKVGNNYTHFVHHIRLRTVTLESRVDDLSVVFFDTFGGYSLDQFRDEPTLFDDSIPSLVEPHT